MKRSAAVSLALLGLSAAALVPLQAATPALAASPSKREKAALKRYCSTDATIFCSNTDPGSPQMRACFKAHMKELSKGCRRAIGAYEGAHRR